MTKMSSLVFCIHQRQGSEQPIDMASRTSRCGHLNIVRPARKSRVSVDGALISLEEVN